MPEQPERWRYTVVPDRSAVVLDVTTSVGPVRFGAMGLEGFVEAAVHNGEIDLTVAPMAHLELQVTQLTSGNAAYDDELRRHVNARGFPAAYVDLDQVVRVEGTPRTYRVGGALTFHGITEPAAGVVIVDLSEPETMVIRGEEPVDIRRFGVPPPTLFMIRIEPEVKISLQLEVHRSAGLE